MPTTVVALKRSGGKIVQDCDVYVGRKLTMGGWNLDSPYGNPFKGKRAVYEYYKWIMEDEQKELRDKAKKKLTNKCLGCFCKKDGKPVPCHGDILVYICDGKMPKELKQVIKAEEGVLDEVKTNQAAFTKWLGKIEPLSSADRIAGMFTCAFMGDALGMRHEFTGKKVKFEPLMEEGFAFTSKRTHQTHVYAPGQVTDDSEMTIILATHVANKLAKNKKIDATSLVEKYMTWANSGQNFMGKNTLELLSKIKTIKGYSSHYEKKFGFTPPLNDTPTLSSDVAENQLSNGALMRCCSLALLEDNMTIYRDIYITNPSIAAEEMECDYLSAIRMALRGEKAKSILKFLFRDKEDRSKEYKGVLKDLKKGKKRTLTNTQTEGKGSIMSAMYATIWCLMWYVNGVKPTSSSEEEKKTSKEDAITFLDIMKVIIIEFPGSDTDTNATICGALLGAVIGLSACSIDEIFVSNMSKIYDYTLKTDRPRPLEYHPAGMFTILPKLCAIYSKETLE